MLHEVLAHGVHGTPRAGTQYAGLVTRALAFALDAALVNAGRDRGGDDDPIPLCAGFVPILLNDRRRGLHDWLAGPVVYVPEQLGESHTSFRSAVPGR
jgi:hypothetical protein